MRASTMQPQPFIVVSDVRASSRFYVELLGCKSAHGGAEYERITHEGTLILQLHRWDAHEHPHMGDPNAKPYGNGALLWFQTADFDAALARASAMGAEILDGPVFNPNAQHHEIWIRDPDG